ncbi:uncharacterized protein LOC132904362 isoform X2 [Amyelois transitella]|uniref:uncharacterized protein LOC132902065 isoform X2 n=1 Tax=Amyelois transitella TaxID=680683 RepID=UPI0029902F57|nr:uncharacterized protein LOC132902065 isoform X2 [Amyelois transitella]XP_060806161.1 uncharacterized protein LOC132903030 isoform X2 [Amyelois transitella]XP_060807530.1 uncharacterized protein LOC132903376 isoform X2 [Amyelois transitella]XP_060810488.1 uncharacterized protein LOC132904362 isoform X2 [Amyelois transitella]
MEGDKTNYPYKKGRYIPETESQDIFMEEELLGTESQSVLSMLQNVNDDGETQNDLSQVNPYYLCDDETQIDTQKDQVDTVDKTLDEETQIYHRSPSLAETDDKCTQCNLNEVDDSQKFEFNNGAKYFGLMISVELSKLPKKEQLSCMQEMLNALKKYYDQSQL